MKVPDEIIDLVDRFDLHHEAYLSGRYNETQLRREFIDPFFEALGWDVNNRQGNAEAYKDVIHEDAIKIGGATKAPDYSFRVGGTRKFFLEAKRPSVRIKDDVSPAFQLRRYAWSAKLPLSILTDFEEFAVYDCRIKPDKNDKASTARTLYLTYRDYVERWDDIASVFSREAVWKGSFDKYAESSKLKKGTAEVDAAFLKEIESWRDALARNIALRNPELGQRDLNFAVQRTIDRIIFLRICEDRGIESYGRLMKLLKEDEVYARLAALFQGADERYNSGLFHFQKEKGRLEEPDELTLGLTIDDKPLKEIIKSLYFPDSPYEFSVLPADILGQVYEQFLGKVIRLTAGHRAVIDDKPEVKKAGGVYYTPTYIVDYIVRHTVGKLCENKKPAVVARLRLLDPACGSGSFLIGAYQYLLDWHLNWYVEDGPEKHKKELHRGVGGEWRLSTGERKRILLNNIYGVDIDFQAVEVTKLSLLLKVLEGESEQTLAAQLRLFHERALPDLGSNIKWGNSLIGPNFYNNAQMSFLDEEERYRINVFDWQAEFAEIMKDGGFDAVIGNPPYLRIQGLQEYYGDQIPYFIDHYQSAVKRFDLYQLFAEGGYRLLSNGGRLGFICPHKFLHSDFGSGLRQFFIQNSSLELFISFGNNLVFNQASTYTGILLLRKSEGNSFGYLELPDMSIQELPKRLEAVKEDDFTSYSTVNFTSGPWALTSSPIQQVLKSIQQPNTIEDVFDNVFQGVVTGVDEVYFLRRFSNTKQPIVEVFSQREGKIIQIERNILKPMLKGEDISRYSEPDFSYYCIYPYKLVGNKTTILQEAEFSTEFPLAYQYLKQYKNELQKLRIKYKTNPKYWYSCHRGRSMIHFENQRIITSEISLGCNMTIDTKGLYHNTMVYSLLPSPLLSENNLYWLGLLNSRIMWWFLSSTGTVLRGGYFRFKTNYLNPFPIRTINFSNSTDRARHDGMVEMVERMLALHKQLAAAKTGHDKTAIQRQIDATDRQIDRLVYELYELTDEEIRIVEEATGANR